MRRTALSAIVAGIVGFVVAVMMNPLAGLGEAVGVSMAIVNLRVLDRQIARVEIEGEQTTKAVRRKMGGKTLQRLVAATAVVVIGLWLSTPLGIGIVSGLVIYQIVFVINVFRVVAN